MKVWARTFPFVGIPEVSLLFDNLSTVWEVRYRQVSILLNLPYHSTIHLVQQGIPVFRPRYNKLRAGTYPRGVLEEEPLHWFSRSLDSKAARVPHTNHWKHDLHVVDPNLAKVSRIPPEDTSLGTRDLLLPR